MFFPWFVYLFGIHWTGTRGICCTFSCRAWEFRASTVKAINWNSNTPDIAFIVWQELRHMKALLKSTKGRAESTFTNP